MNKATQAFFADTEPRGFPLPKGYIKKPYTRIRLLYGGAVEVSQKDNKTGRVSLLENGERIASRYQLQAQWQDLLNLASELRQALLDKPSVSGV